MIGKDISQFSAALETVTHIINAGPGTRVLQIGAGDGVTLNPLRKLLTIRPRWFFFLLEGRPSLFLPLYDKYSDTPNVIIHQAYPLAAGTDDEEIILYSYDNFDALPVWAKYFSSRKKQALIDCNVADKMNGVIVADSCYGSPLTTCMQELRLYAPDIVLVTNFGEEYPLVKQLAKTARVVCYNHRSLPTEDAEKLLWLLPELGFVKHFRGETDTIWYREKII